MFTEKPTSLSEDLGWGDHGDGWHGRLAWWLAAGGSRASERPTCRTRGSSSWQPNHQPCPLVFLPQVGCGLPRLQHQPVSSPSKICWNDKSMVMQNGFVLLMADRQGDEGNCHKYMEPRYPDDLSRSSCVGQLALWVYREETTGCRMLQSMFLEKRTWLHSG